jgi:propionyl-CoA synthetase
MPDAYEKAYADSLNDPLRFWAKAAEAVEWMRRPRMVLDDSTPPVLRWFPGGMLNTCANALDLHVLSGRGEQAALIYDSPVTGTVRTFSYRELTDQVARFAGALRALGVERGDRVLLYMPMVPEAVVGMLATARLGAIHSVVFGGFASNELAQRIQHASPKVVLTASCGIEPGRVVAYKPLLDAAIEQASNKPERVVVLQRPEQRAELVSGRDLDWGEVASAAEPVPSVPCRASRSRPRSPSTSSTRREPRGCRRASCGTTGATRSRSSGASRTSTG